MNLQFEFRALLNVSPIFPIHTLMNEDGLPTSFEADDLIMDIDACIGSFAAAIPRV